MRKFWFISKLQYKIREGKKGLKETYDFLAPNYDYSKYLFCTRWIEKAEEKIVNKWLGELSSPVIDVGCGTGRYAVKIAGMGISVIALDLSLEMLKMAKKKKGNKILPVLADAECLPLKADSCGSVICTLAFNHLFSPASAVYEFRRVLKETGICIMSSFNKALLRRIKQKLNLPYAYMPFRTKNCGPTLIYEVGHNEEELKGLFQKAGFRIKAIEFCPVPISKLGIFRKLTLLFVFKLGFTVRKLVTSLEAGSLRLDKYSP